MAELKQNGLGSNLMNLDLTIHFCRPLTFVFACDLLSYYYYNIEAHGSGSPSWQQEKHNDIGSLLILPTRELCS